MVNDPQFPLTLPFDLSTLLAFTLSNPFSQTLANASCNDFFASYTAQDGSGRIRVRREDGQCWNSLPIEWREHFEAIKDEGKRTEMLKKLSVADEVSRVSSASPIRVEPRKLTKPFPVSLVFKYLPITTFIPSVLLDLVS